MLSSVDFACVLYLENVVIFYYNQKISKDVKLFSFFKKRKNVSVENETEVDFIEVSAEVMDAAFDRSPGRDCAACGFPGSHHTDKHNEFALAALFRINLI